jgi:hypothetical protein
MSVNVTPRSETVLMVKSKVAIESHPSAFKSVAVYTPEAVYVVPLADQVKLEHAVSVVNELVALLIVKSSVLLP